MRFIANRSSGQQGQAIAAALAGLGARVTLVQGPVALPDPAGVRVVRVETAAEMLAACRAALPADVGGVRGGGGGLAGGAGVRAQAEEGAGGPPALTWCRTRTSWRRLSAPGPARPGLVVGFAAETDEVAAHAAAKRARKGCDWIVANDVRPETGIMGGAEQRGARW